MLFIASGEDTQFPGVTGDGNINFAGLSTDIVGSSLILIAVNEVTNAEQASVTMGGGSGAISVAQGSANVPQFGLLNATTTDLTPEYTQFIGKYFQFIQDVSNDVTQTNLAGNLIGLQQLAYIDLGLFEEDLSLFGIIGQGIALALAQCEEQEGCAPNVTEAELKALIEQLEARIAELERRLADPTQARNEARIKALLEGYRAQLAKFMDYKAQLDQYMAQEAAAAEDLVDDFTGDLGGGAAANVPAQVRALGKVLDVVKGRISWLEGLKADAGARSRLSQSSGVELTLEAIDKLIEAAQQEIKFIENQIQQLQQGKQAILEPFRAESGSYAMIDHVQMGPALLDIRTSSDGQPRWH